MNNFQKQQQNQQFYQQQQQQQPQYQQQQHQQKQDYYDPNALNQQQQQQQQQPTAAAAGSNNYQQHHHHQQQGDQQQQYQQEAQQQQQQPEQEQEQQPQQQQLPYEVRWSWNRYPTTKIDAARMIVPLGCMLTPIAGNAPECEYAPLKCSVCSGILNKYCQVDHRSKSWQCPLCTTRNTFPPQYASITENSLPTELQQEYDTVEYVLPNSARTLQPCYVLVVDACTSTAEELDSLKEVLRLTIEKLPPTARVALITYSATVRIHELVPRTSSQTFARSVVFRGSTEVTTDALKKLLTHPEHVVATLSDVELELSTAIDDLAADQWPVGKGMRPLRCTGAAISAAAALLDLVAPKCGSCIMSFLSGATTEGPGQVVDLSRELLIRGHNDLRDNTPTAKYFTNATQFYDGIMRQLVKNGHCLHVLMANLDQCGLAEMRQAVQATGGLVIASDSWTKPTLRSSIMRMFPRREDGSSAMALNVTIECATSPSWKVAGCAGQCIGTGKRSPSIAESEMGMGGTCQWTTSSMDYRSTFAFFFDPCTPTTGGGGGGGGGSGNNQQQGNFQAPRAPGNQGSIRYVQFITKFELGATDRVRVTTLTHIASETSDLKLLTDAFDQDAAAVLLARLAVLKADATPETQQVMSWLDKTTIQFVKRFGEYVRDQPGSLKLSNKLSMFPLFVFHLRRSPYLQVFNSSPDETALYRLLLLKSPTGDATIMIHPTLFQYSMQGDPTPVPLDTSALVAETVLVLDTFFEVIVYLNDSIAAWKAAGYEEDPEYEYFKDFLKVPRDDAQKLAADRFPAPRVIECVPNDGNDRILMNRINPSKPARQPGQQPGGTTAAGTENRPIFTDDASWQSFLQQLKKVAVQS